MEKIPEEKGVYMYSGDKVELSIDVFCQGPFTFTCQWRFGAYKTLHQQTPVGTQPILPTCNDPEYCGSQTTTLIINECQSKHDGCYQCVVSSDADNTPVSCETYLHVNRGMLSTQSVPV